MNCMRDAVYRAENLATNKPKFIAKIQFYFVCLYYKYLNKIIGVVTQQKNIANQAFVLIINYCPCN